MANKIMNKHKRIREQSKALVKNLRDDDECGKLKPTAVANVNFYYG